MTMLRYPCMVVLFSFLLAAGQTTMPAWSQSRSQQAETDSHTVSGVLEQLDLKENKGTLKTSLGKAVSFEIVKPELFSGISVGQKITIQLDDRGRAIKAIESHSIPELPAPAQ